MLTSLVAQEYWSGITETLPRGTLEDLQWRQLKKAIAHARDGSPFWRDRLPPDVDSLEDFTARVPLLHKDDLVQAGQAGESRFGTVPSLDPSNGIRYHQTSGSSGKSPIRTFDTNRDWAILTDSFCTGLWAMGVRPGMTAVVAFGYGLPMGLWGMHGALERMGCLNIPSGGMDSKARVIALVEHQIEVLGCTFGYLRRLIEVAQEMGIDLARQSNLKLVMAGAEPRTEAATEALESKLGCPVFNAAGTTETGVASLFECTGRRGAVHTNELLVLDEVLDPQTHQPVPYGTEGIRVSTTLGRESFQVFRHWTEDRVIRQPGSTCPCGRTWDYFQGGILGRRDDATKVRGVLVSPEQIDAIVTALGFPDHRVRIQAINGLDTLVIEVPVRDEVMDPDEVIGLADSVKQGIGTRPIVRLVDRHVLGESDWKVKRFIDER